MLLQFSVENFKSLKEKAVLSLEAAKDTVHPAHVANVSTERILKTAVIFGANAAGKSNLFQAMTTAILMIRNSSGRQINAALPVIPFKFAEDTASAASAFEFVFIAGDGKKYVYGFSATKERVKREYLYVYNTRRASIVFERENQNYKFTNAVIKSELQPIISKNTDNKLFLATATEWNAVSTKAPYLWFYGIDTYTNNYESLISQDLPMLEEGSEELKRFIRKILKEADINIWDYIYKSEEESAESFLARIPLPMRPVFEELVSGGKHKSYSIMMLHKLLKDGKEQICNLPMEEESQGTRSLFMLSPVLLEAFKKGRILCIDEFDNSLHPLLVKYLVSLFYDPEMNTGNAQLVISSHTTTLLSRDFSRDDEIYFVDKDRETGESELYSLDDFSNRKNLDIRKAYLLGRFGAIPEIKGGELQW